MQGDTIRLIDHDRRTSESSGLRASEGRTHIPAGMPRARSGVERWEGGSGVVPAAALVGRAALMHRSALRLSACALLLLRRRCRAARRLGPVQTRFCARSLLLASRPLSRSQVVSRAGGPEGGAHTSAGSMASPPSACRFGSLPSLLTSLPAQGASAHTLPRSFWHPLTRLHAPTLALRTRSRARARMLARGTPATRGFQYIRCI